MIATLILLADLLTLKVTPQACISPCPIRITIQVTDAQSVDWVDLQIEGTGLAQESHRSPVNMGEGRRTYELTITLRGGGEYTVYAQLWRRTMHRGAAKRVTVLVAGDQ